MPGVPDLALCWRVTDWHKHQLPPGATLDHDPGVDFVQALHARFKAEGRKTVVMAASFRTTEQVLALAGCDRLTIAPALIEALAQKTDAVQNKLEASRSGPRSLIRSMRLLSAPL